MDHGCAERRASSAAPAAREARMNELLEEVAALKAQLRRAGVEPAARSRMTVPDPTTETGYREVVSRRVAK